MFLPACIFVLSRVYSIHGGQKSISDPRDLELQMGMRLHVGAGNGPGYFWNNGLYTLSCWPTSPGPPCLCPFCAGFCPSLGAATVARSVERRKEKIIISFPLQLPCHLPMANIYCRLLWTPQFKAVLCPLTAVPGQTPRLRDPVLSQPLAKSESMGAWGKSCQWVGSSHPLSLPVWSEMLPRPLSFLNLPARWEQVSYVLQTVDPRVRISVWCLWKTQ